MREHIETIPLIKAFQSEDECPFCYLEFNKELTKELSGFTLGKSNPLKRIKRPNAEAAAKTSLGAWLRQKEDSCYVCNHFNDIYNRYLEVFFDT